MPKPPSLPVEPADALDGVVGSFPPFPGSVIPLLQAIQARHGYLAEGNLVRVARYTHTPLSRVYGVATFYSQFRLDRPGRHLIRVCQGTACHVLGANDILDQLKERLGLTEGETTKDGQFTLEIVRCLGCCSLAPAMMIDSKTYGRLTRRRIDEVIAAWQKEERA